MYTHNNVPNFSNELKRQGLVVCKGCLVAVSEVQGMRDGAWEGVSVEAGWIKSARNKNCVNVYVCICAAGGLGMGVSAVNLDVTDRKTVADHYHKSDKR